MKQKSKTHNSGYLCAPPVKKILAEIAERTGEKFISRVITRFAVNTLFAGENIGFSSFVDGEVFADLVIKKKLVDYFVNPNGKLALCYRHCYGKNFADGFNSMLLSRRRYFYV